MDTQWFLTRNGETVAQYSTDEFRRAVAKRWLRPTDFVRRSDSSTYISAAEFLPASYQPRSAVPRVLGRIGAFLAVFVGVWAAFSMAGQHLLSTAMQNLAALEAKSPAGGDAQRDALRAQLLADEVNGNFYKALSEKDPQAFETLLEHFAGHIDLTKPDEAAPRVRSYLMKAIVEPKMRDLSDDDKAEMLKLNRDTSLHLATTNPKMCIAQALGRPTDDVRPHLSPELSQREADLMLRTLLSPPQTVELQPAAELQALNTKVGKSLYQKHGDDIALLDLENVPEGKEEAACRLFAGYLDEVLTLPENERIALVRAMMVDSSRLSETQPSQTPQEAQAPAPAAPAEVPLTAPPPPAAPRAEAPSADFPSGPTMQDNDGAGAPDPDGPPVDLQAQQ